MRTKSIHKWSVAYAAWFLFCVMILPSLSNAENINAFRWENEYHAYGRTIQVDVEISVPERETFPFLAIEPMKVLTNMEVEKYKHFFEDRENVNREIFSFRSKSNTITLSCYDHKFHPDASDPDKTSTPVWPLSVYDRGKAYAEDNNLTVGEAEEIIRENIRIIYPDVDFRVRDIIVNDRTKYRKTGEKLASKGYYEMECVQVINGIPVAGNVHDAYRFGRKKRDFVIANYGSASFNITDRNNFGGSYVLWDTKSELGLPERILPFDVAKEKIEGMILTGNVRKVHHATLGYAQYDLPEGSVYEFVLSPAWVFWVDWMDDASEESDYITENGSGLYSEWYGYKPIIVNAVTGENTNPLDESGTRMLLPESCMEWVEGD